MGRTSTSISFFNPNIKIQVEECTRRQDFGKAITIQKFSGAQRCSLEEFDNGELLVTRQDGAFIMGREV